MTRKSRPRVCPFLWRLGILLPFLVSVSHGETIRLKNGKAIDGEVVRVTPDVVMIDRGGVELQLARAQVVEPDLENLLVQARQAAAKNDHKAATALCRQILAWEPDREDAKTLLVESEEVLKSAEDQQRAQLQAAARERASEERREKNLIQAERLVRENKPVEAAAILEKILEEKPDHAAAGRLLGQIREAEQAAQRQLEETKRKVEAASEKEKEALRKAREESERAQRIQRPEYVQNAVRETLEKLQAVQDYVCTRTIITQTPEGPVVVVETVGFKRPDLYACTSTHTQSPVLGQAGSITITRVDKAAAWALSKGGPPPDAAALAAKRAASRGPEEDRDDDDGGPPPPPPPPPEPEKPTVMRYDRERLRQAGCDVKDVMLPYFDLAGPFDLCATDTVRLERETDNEWAFLAKLAARLGGAMTLRIVIGRSDGIATGIVVLDPSNNPQSAIQFTGVKLNVGLKDEEFAFKPTDEFVVKDVTQDAVAVFAQQRAQQ